MKQKAPPARTWTTGMFPQSTGKVAESKAPNKEMMTHKKALDKLAEIEEKRRMREIDEY